jgi:AhpD family alkylhydroperoxidase
VVYILSHTKGGLAMKNTFNKRIYTSRLFFSDVFYLIKKIPAFISLFRSSRISRAFGEKIMLATTAVNQCVLCARFHSEMAYQSGVDRKEVASLLNMDLNGKSSSDYELTALMYAQHYAETERNPKPEMAQCLYDEYGREKADDIMLIIRLINLGNLSGNTFAAFKSRLKGVRAPDSSLIFEVFFVILSSPLIIPSWIYVYVKKNSFNFQK